MPANETFTHFLIKKLTPAAFAAGVKLSIITFWDSESVLVRLCYYEGRYLFLLYALLLRIFLTYFLSFIIKFFL